jgi:translation initiation factor 2 subunit 1
VPRASNAGWAQLTPSQPKVVSDTDDAELKELMERFEAQNMDVAGDEE